MVEIREEEMSVHVGSAMSHRPMGSECRATSWLSCSIAHVPSVSFACFVDDVLAVAHRSFVDVIICDSQ